MNYAKIAKIVEYVLLILGLLFGLLVLFNTSSEGAVDAALYCAYAMAGIAIAAIVVLSIWASAVGNPKGLIKGLIIIVVAVALIFIVYAIAPGADPVGYLGEVPSKSTLKITETMLYLTYLLVGCAALSIIVGAIVSSSRK